MSINRRMSSQARSTICDLHDRLVAINGAGKVLNDPARSLQRLDLLKHLYQCGKSTFNAYRATEPGLRPRFPVFIRHELRSLFDQPTIARDPAQYVGLLHGIRWLGASLREQIVIEFCDTADATGLYRKYGAFVVGDRIVPRHIFFSRNWHVRVADIVDPATTEEELRYLDGNPHADALLDSCRQAGISYGRIDYGMLDGRPQIWEINTNASVASTPQAVSPSAAEFCSILSTASATRSQRSMPGPDAPSMT